MKELKPCPFCGYDLREDDVADCITESIKPDMQKKDYQIKCPFCDARSSKQWDKDTAIEVWNDRKVPAFINIPLGQALHPVKTDCSRTDEDVCLKCCFNGQDRSICDMLDCKSYEDCWKYCYYEIADFKE
jgi:hypothetical protein